MALLMLDSILLVLCLNVLIFGSQGNPEIPDLQFYRQENATLQKKMLNVESDSKAPDSEVVHLRILSKRSADDDVIRVHLSAFGKEITLHLQRNEDYQDCAKNVKLFMADLTDAGFQLEEVKVEGDDPGVPYIDTVEMAAVTVRHGPDGELQMDGVIGDDFLIKPAPSDINRLSDFFAHDWDFSDGSGESLNSSGDDGSMFFESLTTSTKSNVHVVYRNAMKSKRSFKVMVDDVLENMNSSRDRRSHERPLHAWPEVLLMVDYDTYALHLSHGSDDAQIRRYYVSFMNGVDLRFKIISDPKISLILSGIAIYNDRDATPFLKNNLLRYGGALKGPKAAEDFATHMYTLKTQSRDVYPDFDIAILLTKHDMCNYQWFFFCDSSAIGIAPLMGACDLKHDKKKFQGVAIVEDHGSFAGILVAAHEIAHLLGAFHDGEYYTRQGTLYRPTCRSEDGYLMSPSLTTKRPFEWSNCSIEQMRHFLSLESASCLFNQPSYRNKLEGSELPGLVLSLDEQCKRIAGTRATAWDSRVCVSLQCIIPPEVAIRVPNGTFPAAAEGSFCGEGLHCRNGKCVSKSLAYSQAWNMNPVLDSWKYPKVSTTIKPPLIDEACTDDAAYSFCDSYFRIIGQREACKNSHILEDCCYSRNLYCKINPIKQFL